MWNKYKNHSNGDVGMGCTMRKIVETRKSPSIKDASTIMCNPSLHNSGKRVTHDCASILDRRGFPCLAIFRVVNPIPTSPFIQLNDFCTCSIIILAHPVSFVSSIFSFAKILHPSPSVSLIGALYGLRLSSPAVNVLISVQTNSCKQYQERECLNSDA